MINLMRLLYTQKPRPTLHPPYRELDVAHANRRWHNECFKQEMPLPGLGCHLYIY